MLAAASDAAGNLLARGPAGMGARDMAELMWAFAKSEYRPPEALLQRVLQVRPCGNLFVLLQRFLPGLGTAPLLCQFCSNTHQHTTHNTHNPAPRNSRSRWA